MKTKGMAIVLSLFLGGIGGHWFYLGRTGRGVAYLLLCWTFIPAILAFFEMLRFIFMSVDTFDELYND